MSRWQRFCVVGVGGHARTKLIPAIEANGQQLVGLVSGQPPESLPDAPVFARIEDALAALPADTAFVIASPPTAHFDQALPILDAGRDLIVEKPPFVTEREATAAVEAAARSGSLLIDGFMNRHTLTHRHFVQACRAGMPAEINCAFTIPEAPADSFRSDTAIGSSNLYDIGSYLLAALLDIGLKLDALALDRVDQAGLPDRERLHLSGPLDGVAIEALIGVDDAYANRLELRWPDGRSIVYQPFFYGRATNREVTYTQTGATRSETVEDVNAFQAMFDVPLEHWRATAAERGQRIVTLTAQLERLGRELSSARAR